jgi:hypothetical protein
MQVNWLNPDLNGVSSINDHPKRRRRCALPAHSKLKRSDQSRQQGSADWNIISQDVFVRRVSPVTLNAQAIEDRHSQGSDKISV